MSFAETLKEKRTAKGLSQQKLADAAGVSLRSICNYESGAREPGIAVLRRLADSLGTTSEILIGSERDVEVDDVITDLHALFAGDDMSEEDRDKVFQAVSEMYFDAKKRQRQQEK
ncbi:MAG: helix-turn-helix transcriptional regulator [Clostridia bacterium]|nr:helix-turn-helix transcriptional regulator [Clostridia bacterium]